MAITVRQALHTVLRGASSVTTLLANGADSIIGWGNLSPKTPSPCVVIRDAGRFGGARKLPNFDQLFHIMVYDNAPSAQAASFVNIDAILEEIREVVNGVSLTITTQERAYTCFIDNLDSPDQYDVVLGRPYKWLRVRIPSVYLKDYRS